MSGSDVLRVALAGLGRAGRLHLKNLVKQSSSAGVVAVCDIRGEQARVPSLTGDLPFYTDFVRMLEEARPHAVIIATPPSSHLPLIKAAAARKVHVFCEKPLTLSLAQAEQICRLLKEDPILFQIGFQRRWDSAYLEARRRLEAGEVGVPLTFKAVARDSWRPSVEFARLEVSGGLLVDMGTHDFDLARWLMSSEVRRVSCEASRLLFAELEEAQDYDNAVVNLLFDSGAIGSVEVSRTGTFGYDVRNEIVGTKGALFLGALYEQSLLRAAPSGLTFQGQAGFESRFEKAFQLELEGFLHCVLQQRAPECGLEAAVRSLEIALAARRSVLDGGRPVTVERMAL